MGEQLSYDVFLSYSKKDISRIRPLANRLREANLRVWFDDSAIEVGANILLSVEEGLKAAKKVVVCLSPAALDSDWVQLERSAAQIADLSTKNRRLIPLLLENCVIPDTLQIYSYVDFRRETPEAFEALLRACSGGLGFDGLDETDAVLAGFLQSLSSELRQALDGFLGRTGKLGPENPDNEDTYIELRREFLEGSNNLLDELLQKVQLCQCDAFSLQWMKVRHEVGRIFLEKRRGTEALDVLGGMQELLEGSMPEILEHASDELRRLLAKMLDSIGEAVRFGPESDTKRAKDLFQKALELSPGDHFALKHLGTIYRLERRYEEAEACFKNALKAKRTHHVHFSLAYLYSEWENSRDDLSVKAREQYDSCEAIIREKGIKDYYRVYLKKGFLALRQGDTEAARAAVLTASRVLSKCTQDDFVRVSNFASLLLYAILYDDMAATDRRLGGCEEYLQAEIDGMSLAVFDCVYRDLKREIDAPTSILMTRVKELRRQRRGLAEKFDKILDLLRMKESLLLRQSQNVALLHSESSLGTVFPLLDSKLVVYLKVLPGRESQIYPALEHFHAIYRAAARDDYTLKLSFEGIARRPSGAFHRVSRALELLLDHAALVALDKAESTHFDFQPALWKPFTALVSRSLQMAGFPDHFSLPEQHGGNDLVRVFSAKLIGADSGHKGKRVFVNSHVGCSLACKFCYLPAYGIPIDEKRGDYSVDVSSLAHALEAKQDCFEGGRRGTLLSVGSFTEPFLSAQSRTTMELLHSLARLGNPIQVATRRLPAPELIQQLEGEFDSATDRLMVNVSINNTAADARRVVDDWLEKRSRLNVTVYAKPFLDETAECFDYFVRIGSQQDVSFVVGSLYFGERVRLSSNEIRNHHPDPYLKSPVVPKPTTPGIRNSGEEGFRARLEDKLGRTVFKTSSCALAAKMRIPDPLGNYGGHFCVAGCPNEAICRGALDGPPST